MAVRFTEDLVPDEDQRFPRLSAWHHYFSNATMAMARHIIDTTTGTPTTYTSTSSTSATSNDLRRVLDLMEWWNSLPATGRTVPWFQIDNEARRLLIDQMFERCHVCLMVNKGTSCKCTATERDEKGADILYHEIQRLDLILSKHEFLCLLETGTPFAQKLMLLERSSTGSPAWAKAVNSETCWYLGWSLYNFPSISRYVYNATEQMNAYSALSTKQPPFATHGDGCRGRGLSVIARLKALDVADPDKKRRVQLDLHAYLNHGQRLSRGALKWEPQPEVLHRALRAIETYERGMQCTLLALGVAKAFRRQYSQQTANTVPNNNAMHIVVTSVLPFLGPPAQYDKDYLLEWWNMSL